jgi:hypothetical protein
VRRLCLSKKRLKKKKNCDRLWMRHLLSSNIYLRMEVFENQVGSLIIAILILKDVPAPLRIPVCLCLLADIGLSIITTNMNPPVWEDWRSGFQCFLCANPRTSDVRLKRVLAFRMPIELSFKMPGIWQWASCIHGTPYRIPDWHPARSKVLPAEKWF